MTTINILGGLISVTLGASVTNPAGNNTNVQFNDSGAFGGSDGFTFNKANNTITLGAIGTPGTITTPATGASSNGLTLTIQSGNGGATSGNGGLLSLLGGAPIDGNGGAINITAGSGGTTTSTNRLGGNVVITGGVGVLGGNGGSVSLTSGQGGPTGPGGNASLIAAAGGGTSGAGGQAIVTAGSSTSGNGGNVTLTAGNGGGAGNNGNIQLTAGTGGGGNAGALVLTNLTTTGAQTATFAATNKPGAATGAPSTWLRCVVAGTTFWVPLFAN